MFQMPGLREGLYMAAVAKAVSSHIQLPVTSTVIVPPVESIYSGPAKGYLEALERRLEETETALLRICSAVNEETIQSAFTRGGSRIRKTRRAPPPPTASTEAKKAAIVAQWDRCPLQTASDLSSWADAMLREPSHESIDYPDRTAADRTEQWSSPYSSASTNPTGVEVADSSGVRGPFGGSSSGLIGDRGVSELSRRPEADSQISKLPDAFTQPFYGASSKDRRDQVAIDLSRDFQKQFVW